MQSTTMQPVSFDTDLFITSPHGEKLATTDLPTDYQQYIHRSRYSKWTKEHNRREYWYETVKRYCDFFYKRFPNIFPYKDIYNAILNLETMPSMRALMTAGPALERDEIAGFNCAYVAVDHPHVFDEILFILMCGTGVGFSVENASVECLPVIAESHYPTETVIGVRDSKIGWATAFRELIAMLYAGKVPKWDVSKVRPAGARLKTFGGRASGPEPLVDLFKFTISLFKSAAGRRLKPSECHDLVCKVAEIVVVGGVRRSALISLSNLSDRMLATAKSNFAVDQYSLIGDTNEEWIYTVTMKRNQPVHPTYRVVLKKGAQDWVKDMLEYEKKLPWFIIEPHRALANNSVAYNEKPDMEQFFNEWHALFKSKSGERGIFNRAGAIKKIKELGKRDINHLFGLNPCGEILLRSSGLCNLTEIVIRSGDSLEVLKEKARIASILGTFQATLDKYRYVRDIWMKNQKEERLLGVSMTGIMDHEILSEVSDTAKQWLNEIRETVIKTNKLWAGMLGINPAAATTTVKPSGTVSQLVYSGSGMHKRHAPYYLRTVRADKKDPLAIFMRAQGFIVEDDLMKPEHGDVFTFAQSSPPTSKFRTEGTAIEQLEHYLMFKNHWCEHNPSITVYVKEHEWLEVGHWVFNHFDDIGGVSFLPNSEHSYQQAPYQDCTREQYEDVLSRTPKFNWGLLPEFEKEDTTTSAKEYACVGNTCELVL